MPSGLYDADGKIRLTQSPGSGFCGRYAPDGSIYFTTAPGSGFCGSTAPDGSMYIVDATGSTTIGVYAPNGAIRVTTGNEYNGAWRVSGVSSVVASWDASTSTLALLAAITTHTRASLATMFDSTGKLTYAPNNLALYASDQSNAAWTAFSPSGSATAGVVTFTGAGNDFRYQTVTVGQTGRYIVSVLLSSGTKTGTVVLRDGILGSTTVTLTSTPTRYYYYTNITAGTYTFGLSNRVVDGGDGIAGTVNVSGYTLSAVTYETTPRTADQVITTSAAYYGPRIDYDPNTLAVKGLLIEEARTNLALQSALASGWNYAGSAASTDGTLAPDGATLAKKVLASAGSTAHEIYNVSTAAVSASTTYTNSIFVKKGNHRYVFLNIEGSATAHAVVAVFDLDNPSAATQTYATGSGSFTSSSISAVGGGWYLISLTGQISTATAAYLCYGFVGAATGNTGAEPTFTAAGTEYGYFFGAQLELGSFTTSYIPTAAASVTRAADVVQFTGAALTALQGSAWSAAVQFADVASYAGNPSIFDTSSNLQTVFMNGNKAAFFPTSLNTANGLSVLASHRIAASATRSGGRSIVSDGGTVATDATAMTSPPNTYLGSNVGAGNFLNGHVASFAIYNQRLPDVTLQAKSVVGASY